MKASEEPLSGDAYLCYDAGLEQQSSPSEARAVSLDATAQNANVHRVLRHATAVPLLFAGNEP
jgi:hypothetical protein